MNPAWVVVVYKLVILGKKVVRRKEDTFGTPAVV
jgi:hypothetical protein